MGRTDWDKILSVNTSSLTDDEIEDLYPTIIQCNVDEVDNAQDLRTLMKLSQEMLQYKDNQVESLLLECSELKETIASLKPEASKRKKKDRFFSDGREDESIDTHSKIHSISNYEDTSHTQTEKIATLMIELEGLDKENGDLKNRLVLLTEEMEDATEKMDEMSKELGFLQNKVVEYKEKIVELEHENVALIAQVEGNTRQISKDKLIEEFDAAIDAKIAEWQDILQEKDAEIDRLKENLSQSLMQSVTSLKEQNKSEIVHLNTEIEQRDKVIVELQTKLSEAVVEINESASLIEKLKVDAKKPNKTDKRKEQRDLLKKMQEANAKISDLQTSLLETQEDAKAKSSQLCETLSTLRRYEDENQGLAEALREVKELKDELGRKSEHIQDLISVVNKLEMLNSYQEMEIVTLREKLGIPEDESVSIRQTIAKRKEEARKIEELVQQNKMLIEENMQMKSDIRVLKYKLYKSARASDVVDNTLESSTEFLHSTKLFNSRHTIEPFHYETDDSALKKNMQIVIEENEALRKGMHEILDSIRDQDGKSIVEIQSNTLERLLEALDVRHLAGWYHPAMRLQEHLNVIQGSNAELRSQLKQMRKELKRKDDILQELVIRKNIDIDKICADESESEKSMIYISEIKKIQNTYQTELDEWQKQKDSLIQRNNELIDTLDELRMKLETYEKSWEILESGEDKIRKEFAIKIKENIEINTELLVIHRKNKLLEELFNKESERAHRREKEMIEKESSLKKNLEDLNKHNKILECEVSALQSNISNSVSAVQHKELITKYEELSIRFRGLLENNLALKDHSEIQALKTELEKVMQEKYQIIEEIRKENENNSDSVQRLSEITAKELLERQRADHMTRLHEISQNQLSKCEANISELATMNSELQQKIAEVNKKLSDEIPLRNHQQMDDNKLQDLQIENSTLKIENDNLKRTISIIKEEAEMQYTVYSLRNLEFDSLRHQILDLQASSDDKATISRLEFELTRRKISEMELNQQKILSEKEVSRLEEELEKLRKKCEEMRISMHDYQRQCDKRCEIYIDIIDFLQCQYAGSTSITALERMSSMIKKIQDERGEVESEFKKAKEHEDNLKFQQELLSNRLQIVESLKEILEQKIGSDGVQEIIQNFSEKSQGTLSDFKYKRKITHLEYELQVLNNKCAEYDAAITTMENEMINMQRAWKPQRGNHLKIGKQVEDSKLIPAETTSTAIQIIIETQTRSVQTDAYKCCLDDEKTKREEVKDKKEMHKEKEEGSMEDQKKTPERKETLEEKLETQDVISHEKTHKEVQVNITKGEENINPKEESDKLSKKIVKEMATNTDTVPSEQISESASFLSEKLNEALKLASERSLLLTKYELQITECQKQIDLLNEIIKEKDLQLAQKNKEVETDVTRLCFDSTEYTDKLALKSTINSLQKLISQKEETISRYQTLLKEDRDEHSRAAACLQEEIKNLQDRVVALQNEATKSKEKPDVSSEDDDSKTKRVEDTVEKIESNRAVHEDEIARLREKVSTLEADLNITKQLSERWHQLAEERLKHMDRMRERLEEQHKAELESYRSELNKWQSEADTLRQQLSENRMMLTKGNISLMKELQNRDDKIHELSLTCQQLQNELEIIESSNRSHRILAQNECDSKTQIVSQSINPDQSVQQMDFIRRQLQTLMEKERMYKHEIAELKQRLSRRYMAVKMQDKKSSQREVQLERKVKLLEEELLKAQTQLDREYLVQEVKKAKTAEDLSLWEKQKKWQQTAEKLKEKLKEKTDECSKLNANYEKLRSVISCMEREKWYLKSKLKTDNSSTPGTSARPMSAEHNNLVNELQKECETLRNRVKELTDRLENEDNEQLLLKVEEQARRIAALEAVAQGNSSVVNQLERLEMAKNMLEKANLKLESENFELRLELEKNNTDAPRLREKVEHLQKYIELLKAEKSSESTPRSFDKELQEHGLKKSSLEMEKTIFTLKRIVEKLQAENKRLRISTKKNHVFPSQVRTICSDSESLLLRQYEQAQKRVVALETDLQLAEQRIAMLEKAQKEDENGEVNVLKEQLLHKSELLDKVKHLLTRAAVNEKTLRQRISQLESKQMLSTIPECYVTPPSPQ